MGNIDGLLSCPLPEKIPIPNDDQRMSMIKWGIKIHEPKRDCKYVEYTLPIGWQIVDKSYRSDIPRFCIIDDQRFERIWICGSWKGAYDNELKLYCRKEPFKKYEEEELVSDEKNI